MQGRLNLVSDMLLFLLVTVVVALVGGMLPALVSAVVGSALLNYWFTPPLHTLSIRDTNNTLALVVFLVVAILVSTVVDVAARRTRQAARAAAEAATLADLASGALDEGDALNRMLDRLRSTFALTSATLLERRDGVWVPVAGDLDEALLERADHVVPANDHLRLALRRRTAARRGRAGGRGVRGAGGGGARAHPARARGRRGGGAGGGRPDAYGAAGRRRPRPPHPARRGEGGGVEPAQRRRHAGPSRPGRAARHRGRVPRPPRRPGRQPPRHEPAAGRSDVRCTRSRPRSTRSSRACSTTWRPRVDGCGSTCPTTCRRRRPTPACSSGCWRTWSTTPCATPHRNGPRR